MVNSSKISAPCKDCGDRYVGCHGKCEKYLTFRSRLDEENNKTYKAKQLNMMLNQIEVDRVTAVHNGKMYTRKKRH